MASQSGLTVHQALMPPQTHLPMLMPVLLLAVAKLPALSVSLANSVSLAGGAVGSSVHTEAAAGATSVGGD